MTNTQLIETLARIPEQLTTSIQSLPNEELTRDRQGWTTMEILGHLKDAAVVYDERITRVANEDNPHLPGYDQDEYVARGNYNNAEPSDLLSVIATARAHTVSVLKGLRDEDWQRPGVHGESGPLTLLSLAEHMAGHETEHLADLKLHPS